MKRLSNYRLVFFLSIFLIISYPTVKMFAYDRQNAVSYANQWAGETEVMRNSVYYDYSTEGGDCTNYVSQCLRAGGIRFGSNQGYMDNKGCLIRAAELPNALINYHGAISSTIDVGDPISLSVPVKSYFHSIIVTNIGGQVYFNAHTNDHNNEPFSYFDDKYYDANENEEKDAGEYPIGGLYLHLPDSPIVKGVILTSVGQQKYEAYSDPDATNPVEDVSNPIGQGTLQFQITFDCPMKTQSLPIVKFGKSSPYTTYQVSNGSWSDSTVWTGSIQIDNTFSEGDYHISIYAEAEDGNQLDADEDLEVYNAGYDILHNFTIAEDTDGDGIPNLIDPDDDNDGYPDDVENASSTDPEDSTSYPVDTTPPVITNMEITPEMTNHDPTLTANVTDTQGFINGAEYYIDNNSGNPIAIQGSFDSITVNISAEIDIDSLSESQHTIHLRAKDVAGNWSSESQHSFTVDITPPNISVAPAWPYDDLPIGFLVPVTITDDNNIIAVTGPGYSSGTPSTQVSFSSEILTKGSVTFSVTDEAGNETTISRTTDEPLCVYDSGSDYFYGQYWGPSWWLNVLLPLGQQWVIHKLPDGTIDLSWNYVYPQSDDPIIHETQYTKQEMKTQPSWPYDTEYDFTLRKYSCNTYWISLVPSNSAYGLSLSPNFTFTYSQLSSLAAQYTNLNIYGYSVSAQPGSVNLYNLYTQANVPPSGMHDIKLQFSASLPSAGVTGSGTLEPYFGIKVTGLRFDAPDRTLCASVGGNNNNNQSYPGSIFVADSGNNRIVKYSSDMEFINSFSMYDQEALSFPTGIARDETGNIYVSEVNKGEIKVFRPDYSAYFKITGAGSPKNLFIANEHLYVTDTSANSVKIYDLSGSFQGSLTGTTLDQPCGLDCDILGNIYVADKNNHRIAIFNSSGSFVTSFGSQGSTDTQFLYPEGVAVDKLGYIYVMDSGNNYIKRFDSNFIFMDTQGLGTAGNNLGYFNSPCSGFVDETGDLLVSDRGSGRIVKCIFSEYDTRTYPVAKMDVEGKSIGFDQFEVHGTAKAQDFQNYRLEYGEGEHPTQWTLIQQSSDTVQNSVLGSFSISSSQVYTLRLLVSYSSYFLGSQQNVTIIDTKVINGDLSPPSGSININDGAETTSQYAVTLYLCATDTLSWLVKAFISNYSDFSDSIAISLSGNSINEAVSWTLPISVGVKTVYVRYQDNSGNTSTYSDTIEVPEDLIPPQGSMIINYGDTACFDDNVILSLTAVDTQTMVNAVVISNNPGFTSPATYPYPALSETLALPQSSKLVAFWQFEESLWNGTAGEVKDKANNYSGTAYGNATTSSSGKISRCGAFDGSGDYISVEDHDDFTTGTMTFAAWIYPHGTNYQQPIFAKAQYYGSYFSYDIGITYTNGQYYSCFVCVSSGGNPWDLSFVPYNYIIPKDTWSFFVVEMDGSYVKFYLNGVLEDSVSYTGGIYNSNAPLLIGRYNNNLNPPDDFNGKIDEPMIYKAALSDTEILFLYANGVPKRMKGVEWTIPCPGDTNTVYAKFIDLQNNVSEVYSDLIYFSCDIVPPSGSVTINTGTDTASSKFVMLSLIASDTNSGLKRAHISNSSDFSDSTVMNISGDTLDTTVNWTLTTGNGTKTVYVCYEDNVGNTSVYSDTIELQEDLASPIGSVVINYGDTLCISETVVLSFSAIDTQTGVDKVVISNDSNFTSPNTYTFSSLSDSLGLPQASKMVSFWQFEETSGAIVDKLGNNNLTSNNISYNEAGRLDNCLSYNGSNGYCYKDAGVIGVGSKDKFSVSSWVYWTDNSQERWVINVGDADEDPCILVRALPNGQLNFYVSQTSSIYRYTNTAAGAINLNTWYHIVCTYNAGTIKIYINGIESQQQEYTGGSLVGAIGNITTKLRIGNRSAYNFYWQGKIDEVMMWNDVELTDNEVSFLYSNGAPKRLKGTDWTIDSENGIKTVYSKFIDNAGNVSEIYSDSVEFQKEQNAPSGFIVIDNGAEATLANTAILYLSAEDTQSGLCRAYISNYSDFTDSLVLNISGNTFDTTVNWTLLPGNGIKTIYVKYEDSIGNTSTYSDTIELQGDFDGPVGSVIINCGDTACIINNVVLSFCAVDTQTGVDKVVISNDSNFTSPNTYTFSSLSDTLGLPQPSNIVAFWECEENEGTIYDKTSNHHDSTNQTNITYGETGAVDKGIYLTSGKVEIPNSDDLKFVLGTPMTISIWFKGALQSAAFISKDNSSNRDWCFINGSDGRFQAYIFENNSTYVYRNATNLSWDDGKWHNAVLVWTGETTCYSLKMYYDGQDASDTDVPSNTISSVNITSNPVTIGSYYSSSYNWTGGIDEVLIWRNTALSDSEVSFLYSNGIPKRVKGTDWIMNESETVYVKFIDADSNVSDVYSDTINITKEGYGLSTAPRIMGAAIDLTKAIAYPNPSKRGQQVTFKHITAQTTIYIYNIAGELVRTLDKDDSLDYLNWDLKNDWDEKVSSGVYICFMTNPDKQKKIIKVMVIR